MMELLEIIITGVFSLAVALGSVWLKGHMEERIKKREEKKHGTISENDVDNMIEIQNFLEDFRKKWGLDRIGIFQFHNGGKFFHGVPMKKYSQTFEATASGVSKVKEHNQSVFVTEHPSLMKHISECEFFSVDANDPVLDYLRERVTQEGILQISTAPIRTISGQLIGFVQFHTVKNKIEITEDIKEEVVELVSILSGYLVKSI
jgi:enoyl-[acyl-carrier-protein] reductase (NADH)